MANDDTKAQLDPTLIGVELQREAERLAFSVLRIATATGATRQTVYNWFKRSPMAPYYRDRALELLDILRNAQTAEQAWRKACTQFHLRT